MSHYGTLDQSGNSKELLQVLRPDFLRWQRAGGSFSSDAAGLDAVSTFEEANSNFLSAGYGAIRICRKHVPTNTETPGLEIHKAIELNWQSQTGVRYQVRSSTDMTSWTNDGEVIIGTGRRLSAFRRASESRRYFRVFQSE